MLKSQIIHPEILAALGRAGHGSQILISDGNYPHSTASGPNAEIVYLNLSPGRLTVPEVLAALVTAVPIEHAAVMAVSQTGPNSLPGDPVIWDEYRKLLAHTDCEGRLDSVERFAFYDAARSGNICLTIATGESQIYANILLTIGVVKVSC